MVHHSHDIQFELPMITKKLRGRWIWIQSMRELHRSLHWSIYWLRKETISVPFREGRRRTMRLIQRARFSIQYMQWRHWIQNQSGFQSKSYQWTNGWFQMIALLKFADDLIIITILLLLWFILTIMSATTTFYMDRCIQFRGHMVTRWYKSSMSKRNKRISFFASTTMKL